MKKIISSLLLCLACGAAAFAAPAYPKPRKVVQPDGTVITIIAHGDEHFHYLTTPDGTVVEKGSDGFYRPAVDQDRAKQAPTRGKRALRPIQDRPEKVSGKPFRGLVLLVNFNDRKFSRGNDEAHDFYDQMLNQKGFTGYTDKLEGKMTFTGSMRDYFSDNSLGQFVPQFDVVGPIDVNISQYDIDGVNNAYEIHEKVLQQADSQVDFSRYDSDGDGVADMVYILYAGYSSNYQGNDERLVWPHAGDMRDQGDEFPAPVLDGVTIGRFASSAELYGWSAEGSIALDGIGVMVHEFSHVLGFMDHYDTSNGYQEHPNTWDVMAAGNYSEDFNRTPCAYNSYEKYTAGFITPTFLNDMAGERVTLDNNERSSDACMIRCLQSQVIFTMENRQPVKWDKYLTGHGLLVWRIDSVYPQLWKQNAVNVTARPCFRLVRACGTQGNVLIGVEDTDFDPFPGTRHTTELDNDDDAASLVSYDGIPSPVVLRSIAEQDGIISFSVEEDTLAENRAITYRMPAKFYASAERQEDDRWMPVTWEIKTRNIDGKDVLVNFLPNDLGIVDADRDYSDGVYVSYEYIKDGNHSMRVNAQRVARNADFATWLCDLSDVDKQGAGAIGLTVSRYGVPELVNKDALLGYCKTKPSAYIISQKNFLERSAAYRHVVFSETDPTAVEAVQDIRPEKSEVTDGRIYNLNGQRVSRMTPGHIYIVNGQKILKK